MSEWTPTTKYTTVQRIETGNINDRAIIATYASGAVQFSATVTINGNVVDATTYFLTVEAAQAASDGVRAKVRALAAKLAGGTVSPTVDAMEARR